MGRIRSIKPEYGTSEAIGALSVPCRYHFALLWTYADDAGRGVDNPRLIKAAIWPLDDDVPPSTVEQLQDELACHGRIVRYTHDGRALFEIVNFGEHQHPNRPTPSKLPAPDDPGSFIMPTSPCPHPACSLHAHGALTPVVEGRVGEGRGSSSSTGGSRPDPAATLAAAAEMVVERRGKRTEAETKTRPNAWLASARAGIVNELRTAGADRLALEGQPAAVLADLIEPATQTTSARPTVDPDCPDCEGAGVVDDGTGAYLDCRCKTSTEAAA